jgi:hypothetical protein
LHLGREERALGGKFFAARSPFASRGISLIVFSISSGMSGSGSSLAVKLGVFESLRTASGTINNRKKNR